MGLGIVQAASRNGQHVPGTATLQDWDVNNTANRIDSVGSGDATTTTTTSTDKIGTDTSVKHSRGDRGIILVPQPSNDPNDPLNWPLWQRDGILVILCLVSIVASTLSPLLAANTLVLTLHFRRTFQDIALLTGYHLLGVAVGGIIAVPSARVWGKRHLYLLGTAIIVFSSAWGGASSHSYTSLLWARVFQGVGLAPFEALVSASVADLFYVHERGRRMALANLSLFGGAFFTPVIVGKLTSTLGWEWSFWLLAIFAGALLPAVFFFVPETAYVRENAVVRSAEGFEKTRSHSDAQMLQAAIPKATWTQRLSPFNGRKTDESYFKLLFRPFPLFLHPAVVYAMLIQGTLIGWTVMIGIVLAAIMLLPPLLFTEVQTGYMYTGALVGALVGFALAGLLADSSTRWLTRRNGGIFEPEFRLPILVALQLVLGCAGLYGFGITSANTYRYGWFWPDFFFALEVAGMVLGAVASGLYLVDAHGDIVIEAFTCCLIFKNIFSFGLTWGAYGWIVAAGAKKCFIIVASVQVGVCALTVFMYVFGKCNRAFFARHDLLRIFRLR